MLIGGYAPLIRFKGYADKWIMVLLKDVSKKSQRRTPRLTTRMFLLILLNWESSISVTISIMMSQM